MKTVAPHPRRGWLALVTVAALLAACAAPAGSASPSTPAVTASASASASTEPSHSSEASESASSEPSDDGSFGCDFPVNGVGTTARAQISDVRVGSHDGYDRVVIEFEAGIPEFSLDVATPPLLQDASGMEMDVDGTAFLKLVLQGGTKLSPEGEVTYDGPTDFTQGFPKLLELAEGGDFEAVSTWYFGLEGEGCVRVLALNDPSRLVVDIEH